MFQMPLTDEQRTLYENRLKEAEAKRHLLLTGAAVEQFIDQNGEQVKYTKMNLEALDAYIAELQGYLNPALACYRRPRPIGFLF